VLEKEFPVSRNDVRYNSDTQEVTLEREKFDALMQYVRGLGEQLAAAEDDRDIERYRVRRANASAKVVHEILKDAISAASLSVSRWLEENSILELSRRTGISYPTCYRMVKERLGTGEMDVEALSTMVNAIASGEPAVSKPRGKGRIVRDEVQPGSQPPAPKPKIEDEIIRMLIKGRTTREIAARLKLSEAEVQKKVYQLMQSGRFRPGARGQSKYAE
jgi:hypothetical protein